MLFRSQNEPLPTFAPTQENAQALSGLFGLLGVVGAIAGKGGGQQSAIASMNAMSGMMKGWQQGRADLYQQEKDKFEKNFQTVRAKHQQLEKDFAAAMEKAKYDLEGATADAKLEAIKQGSDVLAKSIELNGLVKTAEILGQNVEDRKKLEGIYLQFGSQEEQRRRARQDQRNLMLERERIRSEAKAPQQSSFSNKQLDKIQGSVSMTDSLEKLQKDFKPEYASFGILGFGADISMEASRRLGGKESQDAISWWSRYRRLQTPERHSLFGATLTGNELRDYQSYTAKPSDSADTIKTFLRDQINYLKDNSEKQKIFYQAAGYKIPSDMKKINYEETYEGSDKQVPAASADQAPAASADTGVDKNNPLLTP